MFYFVHNAKVIDCAVVVWFEFDSVFEKRDGFVVVTDFCEFDSGFCWF